MTMRDDDARFTGLTILGCVLGAAALVLIAWVMPARGDTPTDVGTGFTSSNPAGQVSGLLVNLADNNTADTPAANKLQIKDNDVDLTPSPACGSEGSAGEITLLDVDESATDDWVVCFGTAQAFDIPDTGSDVVASGQLLIGQATAGTALYLAMSGDVAIDAAGATTIQPNSVALATDTTGNFLASLACGAGLSGCPAAGEAASGTLVADDTSATNEIQNLFATIDTSSGTDPAADSPTDTLAVTGTAPITATGNSGTDTVTIAVDDATTGAKGVVQLAGDLAGTATSPGVVDDSHAHTGATLSGIDIGDDTNLAAGAGLSLAGDTLATASTEAGFLTDGATTDLTCGSSNQGKAQTLDDGQLQWCDGATTSALRRAAFGDASGNATGLACADCVAAGEVAFNYAGSASEGGPATTALALNANGGNCSAGQYPLGVDAAGAVESCTADDDVPEAADYSNLTAGTGITNSPTGTINATLGTAIDSGEITDGTIAQADVDDTATLAGNPAFGDSSVWFATTGLIFEGATSNSSETLLTAADPTADRTITLPDESGTVCTTGSVCSGYSGSSHSHTLVGDVDGDVGSTDLDEAAVETELEGVLDLADLQGQLTDGQLADGAVDGGTGGEIADASVTAADLGTDSVSADELNATGVESELEAVLDLSDLQGAVIDGQVPDSITITLAATATALASNPTDCGANQFATTIAASGNLTCAQPAFSDLSGSATAAQLPSGTNTATWTIDADNTGGSEPADGAGVVVEGGTGDATLLWSATNDQLELNVPLAGTFVGNASTATALQNNPADCSAGQYATTIDAAGALTCAQVAFSQLSGAIAAAQLNADYGDFACNGTTCTVETSPASTTNLTFTVDSDNGGSEPADGAGWVIEGGSGTNITATYAATPNELQFAGAAGGYRFDGPLLVSASDGSRGVTFLDNTSEPSAPASGSTLLYSLGGELYKKDNSDGTAEQLMLTSGNVIGQITMSAPSGGQSTATIANLSITAGQLWLNTLTADQIADDAIGAGELSDTANFLLTTGSLTANDNAKLHFGTGQDAQLYYDATDLILNPRAVGSGILRVGGAVELFNGGGTVAADVAVASVADAITMDGAGTHIFGYQFGPTVTLGDDLSIFSGGAYFGFNHTATLTSPSNETRSATFFFPGAFNDNGTIAPDTTSGSATIGGYFSVNSAPTVTRTGSSNSVTLSALTQFQAAAPTINTNTTVSLRHGLLVKDAAPLGTLTAQVGVDIEQLDGAASAAIASNIGLRNAATTAFTPSGTQTIAAAGTISPNATMVAIQSTGSVTTSTTTAIADGANGQCVLIVNVDSGDVVTVDNGGNTRLPGGADCALGQYDMLFVCFNATIGDWVGGFCTANA